MKVYALNAQRGDTLVEVLLSAAILSMVLAGAFTLSNRATRLNQSANERTVASNLMQREVELIRASMQIDSGSFWSDITTNYAITSGENANYCDLTAGASPNATSFYVNDSLVIEKLEYDIPGQLWKDNDQNDLYAIWVEAVDGPGSPIEHTDFFVYACWPGIGGEGMQRSGLVLRLARTR